MIKTIFYGYFLALMVFSCERSQMDIVGAYSLETSTIGFSESLKLNADSTFSYKSVTCIQTKKSEGTWRLEKGVVFLHTSEELPFKEEGAVAPPRNNEAQQAILE